MEQHPVLMQRGEARRSRKRNGINQMRFCGIGIRPALSRSVAPEKQHKKYARPFVPCRCGENSNTILRNTRRALSLRRRSAYKFLPEAVILSETAQHRQPRPSERRVLRFGGRAALFPPLCLKSTTRRYGFATEPQRTQSPRDLDGEERIRGCVGLSRALALRNGRRPWRASEAPEVRHNRRSGLQA